MDLEFKTNKKTSGVISTIYLGLHRVGSLSQDSTRTWHVHWRLPLTRIKAGLPRLKAQGREDLKKQVTRLLTDDVIKVIVDHVKEAEESASKHKENPEERKKAQRFLDQITGSFRGEPHA